MVDEDKIDSTLQRSILIHSGKKDRFCSVAIKTFSFRKEMQVVPIIKQAGEKSCNSYLSMYKMSFVTHVDILLSKRINECKTAGLRTTNYVLL